MDGLLFRSVSDQILFVPVSIIECKNIHLFMDTGHTSYKGWFSPTIGVCICPMLVKIHQIRISIQYLSQNNQLNFARHAVSRDAITSVTASQGAAGGEK